MRVNGFALGGGLTRPQKTWLVALAGLCVLVLSLGGAAATSAAEEPEENVFLGSLPGLKGGDGPHGLAVDQANGTVLVAAISEPATETLVSEVKLFPSGGGISIGTLPLPPGGFEFVGSVTSVGIAVDAAGNVYVSNPGRNVVDKFGPAGKGYPYLCAYSGPGRGCQFEPSGAATFGQVTGLAVDQAGDLYVADPENDRIVEFDAAGGDVGQIMIADHPLIASAPLNLAVDGSGDLFVKDEEQAVVELRPGGLSDVIVASATSHTTGITFDADSGLLLLAQIGGVAAYDPSTTAFVPGDELKAEIGREAFGGIATQETAGSPTGDVYVLEGERRSVGIYGSPPPLRPAVGAESVAAVTPSSAQLRAVIEPQLRATHYGFQFGATPSYGDGEVPLAPGGVISGKQVSGIATAQLEGLQPGASYHYRVVATNKEGTTYGPDQAFTTFLSSAPGLPDNRVYEMVSPLAKNGGGVSEPGDGAFQAAGEGEKVTFISGGSFADPQGNPVANQYLATRGPSGWSTQNISPPTTAGGYFPLNYGPFKAFSSDLSRGLLRNGEDGGKPPIPNAPLPGTNAPAGYENFYVRDNEDSSFQALLTNSGTTLPVKQLIMEVQGVTPDLSHVIAGISAGRFEGHESGEDVVLDEWSSGGGLVPVDVPVGGGPPVANAVLGAASGMPGYAASTVGSPHAISADGSRVFWTVGGGGPLFVREGIGTPQARTLALPAGEFVDASTTGSKVLLSSGEVFDVDSEQRLADITEGAGGLRGELGASEDLSTIYFVDTAVLPGAGAGPRGQTPQVGENNLYMYREGQAPTFITQLTANIIEQYSPDQGDWAPALWDRTTRVTPDGRSITFSSDASLTGYDNIDANSGQPDTEIYEYQAGESGPGTLACVSCNPSGIRPSGSVGVPGGNVAEFSGPHDSYYQSRMLSSDGSRVFFNSSEALVAQDTNGAQDVYEYEDGRAHLVSSGTGEPSSFFDADEKGDNVFFATGNELVPQDTDQLVDLYDARVDGGFPAAATEPACTGTGCQGVAAAPPIFATPSSVTFGGVGNFLAPAATESKIKKIVKCAKGFTKKKNKCVRTKARKKPKAKKLSRNRRAS